MGDGIFEVCERLPFPIGVCPCCGQGTKFSRGFTWITPRELMNPNAKPQCWLDVEHMGEKIKGWSHHQHESCSLCRPPEGKHGLLWVGEKFYTPGSFLQEAVTRGISKRIASFPKGFKIGETVVYLAHKKAIPTEGESLPAIFTAYRPSRVDIVVDVINPDELPARAISIAKKLGDKARIIKIEPPAVQQNLLEGLE